MSKTLEKLDEAGGQAIENITAISESAKVWAGKFVEFLEEQVPEVVEETLLLARVQYTTGVAIGVILLVTAIILFWRTCNIYKLENYKFERVGGITREGGHVILGHISTVVCLVFGILMLGNVSMCAKVWLAPRLYLIEYFSDWCNKLT